MSREINSDNAIGPPGQATASEVGPRLPIGKHVIEVPPLDQTHYIWVAMFLQLAGHDRFHENGLCEGMADVARVAIQQS